jgi:hydrogenase nickel incorporation protein HypA/HybF
VHELALSRAIVDAVERHAEGRRVISVQLRIGALRQVVPESLGFYFEVAARGTRCEGARLEQDLVTALLACPACRATWDPVEPVPRFRCPSCGTGGDAVRGDEFEVESITIEEEEACTAPR